jgi:hypothetical protein
MSKTLKISDNLSLPIAAVTEKLAWLGRTGSGKTYGAMKLAELMLDAGAQIGVLDPVGVWRALRVPAAKDGRAFEVVVFGGLYGDVPLDPGAGKLIADLVVDRGLSFVLDVSQFIPSEQQTFAAAFAHQFFHRKKSAPSAVHLFIEECQEFIPENPSGREALTLGEFQRLWKLGRNFGIGGSLISQRPQEIAKKALNMSGTLFAFQMTGPQERKAIRAWVADQGVAVDIEGVLQKLSVGEPHVESPTFLEVSKTVRILPRVTADLSSTPTVGGTTAAKRPLTPIDVEQLRTQMAETIERAKADDPKELKKTIATLQKSLQNKEHALSMAAAGQQALAAQMPTKTVEILTGADRERLAAHRAQLVAIAEDLGQKSAGIVGEAEARIEAVVTRTVERLGVLLADQRTVFEETLQRAGFTRILEKLDRVTVTPDVRPTPRAVSVHPSPPRVNGVAVSAASGSGDQKIEPAKQRILNALAWLTQLGRTSWTREVVGFVAGVSSRSSAFANNLSALRTAGLLDYPQQNYLQLTASGTAQAAPPDALLTPADLHAQIERLLEPAQWRLAKAVIDAYPKVMTREQLADAAKVSAASSAFANNISRLRTLGLLDYPKQGEVVGTPALFLEA